MSRRTARFEKITLTPGKYFVAYNGSDRVEEEFTAERLKKIAETGKRMLENGIKIPIPFVHFDQKGHTPTPITLSEDGQELDPITGKPCNWDASVNGGFVENLDINDDGELVTVLESFGDENDLNTPAGKIGTTCQETSIGLAKRYVDGKGNVYEDAPIHIAACIKAVEPGQSNFVLLNNENISRVSGDLSIVSMSSQLMTMNSATNPDARNNGDRDLNGDSDSEIDGEEMKCDLPTCLNLLRQLESPIDLPGDTTEDNFVERLSIAVKQKLSDEKTEEEVEPGQGNATPKPPQNAQEKQGTMTMSNTPAPVEPAKPSQENLILMSMVVNQQKKSLQARIDALKVKGVSQETIDKHVTPHMGLDVKTMSMADFNENGDITKFAAAELAISILEDQPVITMDLSKQIGYEGPDGGVEVAYQEAGSMTDEEKKAMSSFSSLIANGQYAEAT